MSKKKLGRILGSILLLLTVLCGIYLFTGSYAANEDAAAVLAPTEDIAIIESDDGSLVFVPSHPKAGLIFYPGGKVESRAYAPLMTAFAQEDILCVLPSMPFDLAVFDRNAADGIKEQYQQIQDWYLPDIPWGALWLPVMHLITLRTMRAFSFWRPIPPRT